MQTVRYLDKLVDELATGKSMEKSRPASSTRLREPNGQRLHRDTHVDRRP
jgi:Uncharacterized protein conserved in bacteria (DUF2200)